MKSSTSLRGMGFCMSPQWIAQEGFGLFTEDGVDFELTNCCAHLRHFVATAHDARLYEVLREALEGLGVPF
jgi:hypothetical protein